MALPELPCELPEWATNEGTAIVEPETAKKATGWIAEKVPFQWLNWLFNRIYKWIDWLHGVVSAIDDRIASTEDDINDIYTNQIATIDGRLDSLELNDQAFGATLNQLGRNALTVECRVTTDDYTTQQTGTITYIKLGRLIFVLLPKFTGTSQTTSLIQIKPLQGYNFPADIFFSESSQAEVPRIPVIVRQGTTDGNGYCIPPYGAYQQFWITSSLFQTSGTKELHPSMIIYFADHD